MGEGISRECECTNYLRTNDAYLLDAWNEWHEEGSFVAGRYHMPIAARAERGTCATCRLYAKHIERGECWASDERKHYALATSCSHAVSICEDCRAKCPCANCRPTPLPSSPRPVEER